MNIARTKCSPTVGILPIRSSTCFAAHDTNCFPCSSPAGGMIQMIAKYRVRFCVPGILQFAASISHRVLFFCAQEDPFKCFLAMCNIFRIQTFHLCAC